MPLAGLLADVAPGGVPRGGSHVFLIVLLVLVLLGMAIAITALVLIHRRPRRPR